MRNILVWLYSLVDTEHRQVLSFTFIHCTKPGGSKYKYPIFAQT